METVIPHTNYGSLLANMTDKTTFETKCSPVFHGTYLSMALHSFCWTVAAFSVSGRYLRIEQHSTE
jgi:hypothetical protein